MDLVVNVWCSAVFFLAGLLIGRFGWSKGKEEAQGEGISWSDSAAGMDGNEMNGNGTAANGMTGIDEREGISGRKVSGRSGRNGKKAGMPGEKRISLGWTVGSPVAGEVCYLREGTGRGARIVPEQGMVYAPAAGKITKLYPTGNAMRLRTDYGIELLIQAGIDTEELEGRYYRSRIVQNEVVNKGKLLLEFDIDGIKEEGYDPSVVITVVEAKDYGDVIVCDTPRVKAGEDLMRVCR